MSEQESFPAALVMFAAMGRLSTDELKRLYCELFDEPAPPAHTPEDEK